MKFHQLKTWPQFFDDIEADLKPFEIRNNDRDFKVGDTLILRRFDPLTKKYTGKHLVREIGYITSVDDWSDIRTNLVVLGLKKSPKWFCIIEDHCDSRPEAVNWIEFNSEAEALACKAGFDAAKELTALVDEDSLEENHAVVDQLEPVDEDEATK